MVRVRRVTRARAAGDGLYCSWAMACSTRARVAGRTLGRSLMTRETVWWETPARRATSKMFAVRPAARPCRRPGCASLIELVRSGHERGQRVDVRARRTARCRRSDRPRMIATRWATRSTSSSSAEMNITDRPLSASSPTRFWTWTFAPTSIPRVGSSSTRARGDRASRRASSTFCWLPPDSVPAGRSTSAGRMSRASTQLQRELALPGRAEAAQEAALGLQREGDVLPDAQLADDALGPAVLRGVDDAERRWRSGVRPGARTVPGRG